MPLKTLTNWRQNALKIYPKFRTPFCLQSADAGKRERPSEQMKIFSFKDKQRISGFFVWFVALSGILLSLAAFITVLNHDHERLEDDFGRAAENYHAALRREIESSIGALSALQSFFLHSTCPSTAVASRKQPKGFGCAGRI